MSDERQVIDLDEFYDNLDLVCTGSRHCVRIDRNPTPRKKRSRNSTTISLLDSDTEDAPVASSSRTTLDRERSPSQTSHPHSSSPINQPTELQNQTELALLRALGDTRPTKRHASDVVVMAMNTMERSRTNLKRKERVSTVEKEQEYIVISSDSEPEVVPLKKARVDDHVIVDFHALQDEQHNHPSETPQMTLDDKFPESPPPSPSDHDHPREEDDDDDDYIDFLASLDISNEANWVPLPESKKAEDLTPMHGADDDTSKPLTLPPLWIPRRSRPPVDYQRLPPNWCSTGPWGIVARNYGVTRFPKPFYHARRQEHITPRRSPSLFYEQGFNKLELTAKYPHLTSGCVNKIIQAPGTVVLSAVVEAGAPDYSDDEDDQPPPPPENKSGSLVVYKDGQVHVAHAHYRTRLTSRGQILKYYSVNDVAFNPFDPAQFLSSGGDFTVQFWEIRDSETGENQGLHAIQSREFNDIPQDLIYAPDGSALAVSCHDGTLQLFNSRDLFVDMTDDDIRPKKFNVAPRNSGHAAGATIWGSGPTSHLLFSSSESTAETDFSGFHRAFDVHKGVKVMELDAPESGDAAALSPDGTMLALFTSGAKNFHPVRLYDVRSKREAACETEELERFRTRLSTGSSQGSRDSQEVNCAAFSPDGCLLAVARSDNALHVYDMRALSRGPLCRFEHHDSDAVGGGGYGIVSAKWVEGRARLGIVSGGNDGCVRLWEPALGGRSEMQGMVIGRTDFDVGHFSVGDRRRGEYPLVIGDSGGGMHTYDFTNPDGVPL